MGAALAGGEGNELDYWADNFERESPTLIEGVMEYRTAGNSVIAFGTATLLAALMSALFFGSCGIDLVAILAIPLGMRVSDGSRRAAKWSIGIMALYFFVTLFMIWAVTFRSERLRLGNRDMSPDAIPWALGFIAIFAVWSLANIALLVRTMRNLARSA